MATQGKCDNCRIRWTWSAHVRLKNDRFEDPDHAKCPRCGRPLKRTSYLLDYEGIHTTSKAIREGKH